MTKNLTSKEKAFCSYFVMTNNVRESAARAGYILFPLKKGMELIACPEIMDCIRKLQADFKKNHLFGSLYTGYERLAFGSAADCIRLLFSQELPENIEEMDLYQISEIKKSGNGGMEIKFFDRFKALEKLYQNSEESEEKQSYFYQAVREGARAMQFAQKDDKYEI